MHPVSFKQEQTVIVALSEDVADLYSTICRKLSIKDDRRFIKLLKTIRLCKAILTIIMVIVLFKVLFWYLLYKLIGNNRKPYFCIYKVRIVFDWKYYRICGRSLRTYILLDSANLKFLWLKFYRRQSRRTMSHHWWVINVQHKWRHCFIIYMICLS